MHARRRITPHLHRPRLAPVTARLRPELADIPAYTPGKTVPGAIKLASNETVHGPLPSVREAIAAAAETINRYPDNGHVELKARLFRDYPMGSFAISASLAARHSAGRQRPGRGAVSEERRAAQRHVLRLVVHVLPAGHGRARERDGRQQSSGSGASPQRS